MIYPFMYKLGDKVCYGPYIISKKLSDLTYQLRIRIKDTEDNIKSYTTKN